MEGRKQTSKQGRGGGGRKEEREKKEEGEGKREVVSKWRNEKEKGKDSEEIPLMQGTEENLGQFNNGFREKQYNN